MGFGAFSACSVSRVLPGTGEAPTGCAASCAEREDVAAVGTCSLGPRRPPTAGAAELLPREAGAL